MATKLAIELTQQRLMELLEYEPQTGIFRQRHDGYNNSFRAGDKDAKRSFQPGCVQ